MTTAHDAPHEELDGPYWSATRIALGIMVVLIVAMWVWIYIWAPRDNPDRLATRSFADQAQARCVPIEAELTALPPTTTDTTILQRAEGVEEGTRLTAIMVAGLEEEAAAVTNADDERLIALWLDDWNAYLADREAYAERLRNAPPDADRADLAFTLTERSSGGIYTRTIDGFAEVNDMSACIVPQDI